MKTVKLGDIIPKPYQAKMQELFDSYRNNPKYAADPVATLKTDLFERGVSVESDPMTAIPGENHFIGEVAKSLLPKPNTNQSDPLVVAAHTAAYAGNFYAVLFAIAAAAVKGRNIIDKPANSFPNATTLARIVDNNYGPENEVSHLLASIKADSNSQSKVRDPDMGILSKLSVITANSHQHHAAGKVTGKENLAPPAPAAVPPLGA